MQSHGSITKQDVLDAIRQLSRRSSANRGLAGGDGLLTAGNLAFAMGVRPERLDALLRELEDGGLLMCVPQHGSVAVFALTELAGDAMRKVGSHLDAKAPDIRTALPS